MIKTMKDRVTVTFIGTDFDVENVISRLGIDKSNTLSYDGTAKGLEASFDATIASRVEYSTNVVQGKDVSRGFYKNIVKK